MLSVGASIIVGLAAGIYIPGRDRDRQEIKDKDKMAVEFAPLKNDLLLRAARGTCFSRSNVDGALSLFSYFSVITMKLCCAGRSSITVRV